MKRKIKRKDDGSIDWSAYNKPRKPLKPISDKKRSEVKQSAIEGKKTLQKPRKPRQKSRATLIRELDNVFSKYIRMRDSKDYGFKYFKCPTCGRILPFEEADNSHYYGRTHMNTRFDEENCWAECRYDNRFNASHLIQYGEWLRKKIGEQRYTLLRVKAGTPKKWECWELEQMIKLYKAKTEQLIEESKPRSGLVKKKIGE